jgi:hypothetical protein
MPLKFIYTESRRYDFIQKRIFSPPLEVPIARLTSSTINVFTLMMADLYGFDLSRKPRELILSFSCISYSGAVNMRTSHSDLVSHYPILLL